VAFPLGVVGVTYGNVPIDEAAKLAAADGFAHIDAMYDVADTLAVPIGDRISLAPRSGCSSGPAPSWSWERTVAAYRAVPGARLEAYRDSCVGSNEAVLAMLEAVPGLRLLVDTGHVASWGGDPLELLPFADHVQLRQGREGVVQARPDDGDVDFAAVLARLRALGYGGLLSVEYFDLPWPGFGLDDPRGHALELAALLRPLLRRPG
jgi:Xylose isomerase-like TIM barrel